MSTAGQAHSIPESAPLPPQPAPRPGQLHIGIVGAGATGVELAAELHYAVRTLVSFGLHNIDADRDIAIHLIEAADHILPGLPDRVSASTLAALTDMGIHVHTGEQVERVDESAFHTRSGQSIEAAIKVWAAGIQGPQILADLDGLSHNRNNQLEVLATLQCVDDEHIYALGDCAQFDTPPPGRRPIEQVWYTGRMQGQALAKTLTGNRTKYEPGFWFNSAKFFDIEYQTYGNVLSKLQEGEKDFYWEHANGKICVKIVFDESTHKFIGINVFGIRCRHERFDKWLREERSVEHVLEHLKDANFDPEFYKAHEAEIVSKFNQENGTSITVKRFSWERLVGKSA